MTTCNSLTTHPAPVLFMDDHPDYLRLYRLLMKTARIEALYTSDAAEVLRICQQQPISLLVSDVQHPGTGGLGLVESLRSDACTRHIPIMLISAAPLPDAYLPQVNAFLRKPADPQHLIDLVKRLRLQNCGLSACV